VVAYTSSHFGTADGLTRLRNIDRILVGSTPTEFGELSYKDHGLLLCEVHVLRKTAEQILPNRVFRDFVEEVEDLVDIRAGLARQMKVVERIRWAYSKYFAWT
jgi:nuclear control of ATPase protein 2